MFEKIFFGALILGIIALWFWVIVISRKEEKKEEEKKSVEEAPKEEEKELTKEDHIREAIKAMEQVFSLKYEFCDELSEMVACPGIKGKWFGKQEEKFIPFDGAVTLGVNFEKLEFCVMETNNIFVSKMPDAEVIECEVDESAFGEKKEEEEDPKVKMAKEQLASLAKKNKTIFAQVKESGRQRLENVVLEKGKELGVEFKFEWQ